MNRSGFQDLSRVRIAEARALLDDGFFAGAYYLTGHAVECALKACVCRLVGLHDFPDRALAARAHTHDLEALVGVARLRPDLDEEVRRSPLFRDNWDTVRAWSVESRYELGLAPPKAAVIYKAVTEEGTGVLNWVTSKW